MLQHRYLERFGSRQRVVRASLRYRVARRIIRFGLRLLFGLRLEGAPPRSGPYVLVANHQNWADVFAILALFPPEPQLYFLGDERQMRRSWWKWALVRFFGLLLPLDRTLSTSRSAIRAALGRLNEGAAVAIFAEGRASFTEGELAPFQRGVGYLALKAGVPVLPVWLRGTADLYLRSEIIVRVGTARVLPALQATRDATELASRVLHDDVAALVTPWEEQAGIRKRWRWLRHIL